jgi:hypothetical protein
MAPGCLKGLPFGSSMWNSMGTTIMQATAAFPGHATGARPGAGRQG